MFFYKKLEKQKKEKNKKPLTKEEEQKRDLIRNITIVVLLIMAVATFIFVANRIKSEIVAYDRSMNVSKDISSMTNGITPLYEEEKEEDINQLNFEIDNVTIYESITDTVYENYESYHKEYINNIYKNTELDDVSYIEIYYKLMNTQLYYYLVDDDLYVSDTAVNNIDDVLVLKKVNNKDVSRIQTLINADIPEKIVDYLDYVINLQYYKDTNGVDFDINAKAYLVDETVKNLSLNDFVEISVILEK